MAIWDDLLSEHDKKVYKMASYGERVGFGERPALLIIDVTYTFVGDKPEPILKSIERYPQSCGENGWQAVYHIKSLLSLARKKRVPIIYADRQPNKPSLLRKRGNQHYAPPEISQGEKYYEIVHEIAPTTDDIVISKECPSIFFGTPLMSILTPRGIDTILVCGGTTSGCIRSSVIDAASYGFKVAVIKECTFDRVEISHKLNLFEMDCKYADVVSAAEVENYLGRL